MKKLVLLDYYLTNKSGHHLTYDLSVVNEAVKEGIPAEILCPKGAAVSKNFLIKDELDSFTTNGKFQSIKKILERIKEIKNTIKKYKDSLFIVQYVDKTTYFQWFFATLFNSGKNNRYAFVIRRGLGDHYKSDPLMSALLKSLISSPFIFILKQRKDFYFLTDSELIDIDLKKRGFKRTGLLPIPHLPNVTFKASKEDVIGFFGGARYEKGYCLLPEIIDLVLKKKPKTKFVIQDYLPKITYYNMHLDLLKETQTKIRSLAKKYPKNIILLEGYLDDKTYNKYMDMCKILLSIYNKDLYGMGTSAILSEGISMGKWIIVPNGTWMSYQKNKYSKISAFDNFNAKSITEAILKIKENIPQKTLLEQISGWKKFHSAKNFIKLLRKYAFN